MIEVMIDIETLGTKPGCRVLEIAAAPFLIEEVSPDIQLPRPFQCVLSHGEQFDNYGLLSDPETLRWWEADTERATQLLELLGDPAALDLQTAMTLLATYLEDLRQQDEIMLWAHSPSFDLTILEHCCLVTQRPVPWTYREQMDVRTWLRAFGYRSPREVMAPEGVQHRALPDALYQIDVVCEAARGRKR